MYVRNTEGFVPRHFRSAAEVQALVARGDALGAFALRARDLYLRWQDRVRLPGDPTPQG